MRNAISTGQWSSWLILFLVQYCGGLAPAHAAELPKRFAVISACPVASVSDRVKPSSDVSLHPLQSRRFSRSGGFRSPKFELFDKGLSGGIAGRSDAILLQTFCKALSSRTVSRFRIRAPPSVLLIHSRLPTVRVGETVAARPSQQ